MRRRSCRRAPCCTSSRGTTTRPTTSRTPIPISGSAGAIAPSTRWATRGSTSPTSRTTSSRRSRRSARPPRRPTNSDSPFRQLIVREIAEAPFPTRGRRLFFDTTPMRLGMRQAATGVLMIGMLAAGVLVHGQQGTGQTPAPWPLSNAIRERGSSVTGAFEGWYFNKDGSRTFLVGYYNRNTKQEFDIPPGPNNKIEPGGPDQGQPTHFLPGRAFGVFTIKVPKDFGDKKLTWTLVSNGQTNTITLHTKPDYIVEPFEDPANKNTPPTLKFAADGQGFQGPPSAIAATMSAVVDVPLPLTLWASDEGPKINIPETTGRGRGRGRGGDAAAAAAA